MKQTETISVQMSDGLVEISYTGIVVPISSTENKSYLTVWTKQRTFLTVNNSSTPFTLSITSGNTTLEYLISSDVSGHTETIEVTDIVRDVDSLTLEILETAETTEINIARVGIADCARLAIPSNKAAVDHLDTLPPSVIYADGEHAIILDVYGSSLVRLNGSTQVTPQTLQQYMTLPLGSIAADRNIMLEYLSAKPLAWHIFWQAKTRALPCDADSAYVEWQSISGGNKASLWKVRDKGLNVSDSIQFATMTDGVDVRKSFGSVMALYLDDLSAYDVWYYSDIIASDVVNVNGRQVNITTSSITYPNGYDRGEVVVNVEFSNFDL